MDLPPPRIVIAEDSDFARAVVVETLTVEGFELHEAQDGREALDLCRITRPDLLILDLNMPRLNGGDVLMRIRTDPKIGRLPVLVLTGDEREETVAELLEAGATDFVVKPARPGELVARVRRILRDKEQYDRLIAANEQLSTVAAQ